MKRGTLPGTRRNALPGMTRYAFSAAVLAAALGLAACAGHPPVLSQVATDAAEKAINTPEQAADLVQRHSK